MVMKMAMVVLMILKMRNSLHLAAQWHSYEGVYSVSLSWDT